MTRKYTLYDMARHMTAPDSFLGGPCLVVGERYKHPKSKRMLLVTGGSYYGGYGRVSNFFSWTYLDSRGRRTRERGHGYGWSAKPIVKSK